MFPYIFFHIRAVTVTMTSEQVVFQDSEETISNRPQETRPNNVSPQESFGEGNATKPHGIRSGPGYKKIDSKKPKRYGRRAGSASDGNNNNTRKAKDVSQSMKKIKVPETPTGTYLYLAWLRN